MLEQIYIFSGLGADERVFQRLDFSSFSPIFIKWITPLDKESIEDYATRLLDQIKTPKPTLVGLSFGGIMAIEIGKQIETQKIILIASAKNECEIPFYFRFAGYLRLHKLLPTRFLKSSNFATNWFFGTPSSFEKHLLKQILLDTDPAFLKWAIDKVARWKNNTRTHNAFHIHGSRDRILPLKFVKCDHIVKGGGHFMTLNKESELNKILLEQIR